MKSPIKRVAAIHDLSGYGRTSLTVIMPILSTMGVQVCPFPTAVLSNNTGYFDEFSFVDLTDTMEDYMKHWEKENLTFDCIYTGFLGSERQVDIILNFIERFKDDATTVVVDPVMGDHGKLYPTIDKNMVKKMRTLVSKSDMITPNFTEAMYLLDKNYVEEIKIDEIKEILIELSGLGPKQVIITSVPIHNLRDDIFVFGYDRETDEFWEVSSKHIHVDYPGTGDIFDSVLIGRLLNGDSLPQAMDKSVEFISYGIETSQKYSYPNREGILLCNILDSLNDPVKRDSYISVE